MPSTNDRPTVGQGPPVGSVNVLEAILGQRGKGKSTEQCHRALELVREYGGAHVLGHSLGARLPRQLPDELGGEVLPIEYHFHVDELDKGLRKRPGNWHIIAPPPLGDPKRGTVKTSSADDLIAYSMRLSQALRDRAYDRAKLRRERPILEPKIRNYDGLPCAPIIVIIDEGIAVKAANTSKGAKDKLGQDWFFEWLISLRHMQTVLLYAIQNPSARSWYLMSEATEIKAFYMRHQWALNAVQAAGATSEQIQEIRSLEAHEYVTINDVTASPDAIERAAKAAPDIDEGGDE